MLNLNYFVEITIFEGKSGQTENVEN
jgi:hypothetical protein